MNTKCPYASVNFCIRGANRRRDGTRSNFIKRRKYKAKQQQQQKHQQQNKKVSKAIKLQIKTGKITGTIQIAELPLNVTWPYTDLVDSYLALYWKSSFAVFNHLDPLDCRFVTSDIEIQNSKRHGLSDCSMAALLYCKYIIVRTITCIWTLKALNQTSKGEYVCEEIGDPFNEIKLKGYELNVTVLSRKSSDHPGGK